MADFTSNAVALDNFAGDASAHEWFVRKYGPCLHFAISYLKSRRSAEHPIAAAAQQLLPQFRGAWQKHYSSSQRT
jgi:hypothetical protein